VGQDPSFQAITKFSIERSDGLTAVSEYLRQETYRAFGCTACAVDVIPNFVDPKVYDRKAYQPLLREQVNGNRKIIMHVSNFRPVKRVRDIVRTFARIDREVPSALVMVGDGPERVTAEQEARDLGVHEHVFFLGKLESVAPLLASADLFLLPSESESFGLSALEALACGVPVVASNVGGLPDVVKDGVTGFLKPVGDVEAMASSAVTILKDRARWDAMSTAAAADARARFAQDDIVAMYERFYEGVVG
jgi:N-acetyl-alpha-D-glucosaminyl L-malate synthase BshA